MWIDVKIECLKCPVCCHLLDNQLSPSSYSPAMLRLHCQSLLPRPAPAPSASLFSPLWLCPPSLLLLTLLTPCPLCPTPANGSARGPDTPGTTHQWWHRPGPRANGGRGGDNQGEYIQTFLLHCVMVTRPGLHIMVIALCRSSTWLQY